MGGAHGWRMPWSAAPDLLLVRSLESKLDYGEAVLVLQDEEKTVTFRRAVTNR